MASMICAVHVSRGAPSCHALAGAVRSQPTRHRSGEVLLPALSRNTDAAFLVSTLNFPPEQEGYLGYAVIIPTLIFIGHSGRALTYIATQEGWLYLAVVIDLFSRQVVGWAMGKRMTRHLVIDALTMAWFRRRPAEGLIFHSDQGSQYASSDFQTTLRGYAMRGSMSRKGNCWDNAVTETLFGSLKVERLHDMCFETRRQAQDEVIDWLAFYNRRRMHSTLGYTSPMAFEENWRRQQKAQAA